MENLLEDFLNQKIPNCQHFRWKEALWLNEWGIYVFPESLTVKKNIIETAQALQNIRDILGKPVHVTSWYRPEKYNKHIGGAKTSYHMQGLAVDFIVKGIKADAVREILLEYLTRLDIRMEDLDGASWVHIDLGKVGKSGKRFFKP